MPSTEKTARQLAFEKLQPTGPETRLAEEFVALLDYLGRLQGGLEGGNWYYVWEKTTDLCSGPAKRLTNFLSTPTDDGRRYNAPEADPKKVQALIQVFAQDYSIGRTLYPISGITDPELRAATEADIQQSRAFFADMKD
jgi:hypothetical protein